jgi:hypothetical protein
LTTELPSSSPEVVESSPRGTFPFRSLPIKSADMLDDKTVDSSEEVHLNNFLTIVASAVPTVQFPPPSPLIAGCCSSLL